MMAAYQPTTGMQPGMNPHGHPAMTPGHPMNPAAQMQQMGHPGVSGPGQPHVSQAGAMMAMQQGTNGMNGPVGMGGQHPGGQMGGMPGQMGGQSMAGGAPNAHAMSHLTPQAAMQQQQQQQQQQLMQQQQLQQNPQLMQQHMLARRQHQMAQMQAQVQANGGMAGMQQAGMQGLNPQQQMQQLQQNNLGMQPQQVPLPQHLLAQQHQLRLQQAQQSQQMQQQLAMQHTNSQQGSQGGQPGPPNQQGGQGQQPGQMRPQSRMANPNQQTQGDSQQTPQQGGQGQQPQPQGQPNQQQGQQQNQQGQQQPMNQQQMNQQQMNQQQMQALQTRQRQMQMQQMQMQQSGQARQMAQVQQVQQQSGAFILRLMLFGDQLSNFNTANGRDILEWHTFVDRHFAPEGRFLHSFTLVDDNLKTFEVPRQTIARYFQMYFDSGAQSLRLHTEHSREQQMPQGRHSVSFSGATLTVAYPNGARLEMGGSMNVLFAQSSNLFECLELQTTNSQETIMRSEIERILTNWSPTMSNKASPKTAKNRLPKAQQKLQSQLEGLTIEHFPKAPTRGELGVTARMQQFLEIGDTMNIMSELICFAQERDLRPIDATDALVTQYDTQGQQAGQQQQQPQQQQGNPQIKLPTANGVPMGARTPSMGNMQMPNQYSSPSVSNLSLPMQNGMPGGLNGSPHISNNPGLTAPNMAMKASNSHTPSPHQSNMAAPPMMPQLSQQGTNSSAASANTSPHVSSKRRRSQAGVKIEGDEGGGDGNQQGGGRVKPSPRTGKKMKP